MKEFYPYWRFFCDNTFAENTKLYFYEDGSFALMTVDGLVALYSNKAELVRHFHNAFILANGCICERRDVDLLVYYKNDLRYSIKCLSNTKLLLHENAVEMINDERYLYFITPQADNQRSIALSDNEVEVENVSFDNKVLLRNVSHRKELVDANGNTLLMGENINRIDFLKNGSYIAHLSGEEVYGSFLYNCDNELVLQSEESYGILPLGDHVCYQNALIADTNGYFVSEYNHEIAVYGLMHIFAYKIKHFGREDFDFWPGGKMMCFRNVSLGKVLCYWHAGHFYFAPQHLPGSCKQEMLSGNHDKPFQHYLKRILEIM